MPLLRIVALLLLVARAAAARCATDTDCTLNGQCDVARGLCVCDGGWGGPACAALRLGVTDPALGHPWGATSSSWGGLPVYDPQGKSWHLFYSQIARGCGLSAWSVNSRVVHAVSSNPLGPFVDVDVVQPAFTPNTQAFRTPDGMWVVWYIGCAQGEHVINCSASSADALPLAPRTVPPGGPGSNPDPLCAPQPFGALGETYISYSWAPSPYGPWTPLGKPALAGNFNRSTWWPWLTNPAPWLMTDGSVLLAVSGDGGVSKKCIGFARASAWNATFAIETDALTAPIPGGEDPFVWTTARGDRHVIWHDVSGRSNGGHAFAPASSPTSWTVTTHELYNGSVTFPNGTVAVANDRERPKLLFDEVSGAPVALFNGMIPPSVSSGNGACFTAVTHIDVS